MYSIIRLVLDFSLIQIQIPPKKGEKNRTQECMQELNLLVHHSVSACIHYAQNTSRMAFISRLKAKRNQNVMLAKTITEQLCANKTERMEIQGPELGAHRTMPVYAQQSNTSPHFYRSACTTVLS